MTAVEYIAAHYQLRYNEWAKQVEWKKDETFVPLSSRDVNTMQLEALEQGATLNKQAVQLYLGSSRIPSFHPVEDLLVALSNTALHKKDYITDLAKRIPCNHTKWVLYFRMWLLGVVAAWMQRTDELPIGSARCELILIGASKTEVEEFCRKMLPEPLQRDHLLHIATVSSASALPIEDDMTSAQKRSRVVRFYARLRNNGKIALQGDFHTKEVFAQIASDLRLGKRWWLSEEEILQIKKDNSRFNDSAEVLSFYKTFVPMPALADGVRALSLSDIAQCVSYHTGFHYDTKSLNRLGRWLTAEARAGNILKRYINGSTNYLVRGNGWKT